ncbi:hypothetical protein ACP4OV_001974 [Aristida adscensionis]
MSDIRNACGVMIVVESERYTPEDVTYVHNAGAYAILVGECLMMQDDPARAIASVFGKELLH